MENLRDELIGALVGLSRALNGDRPDHETHMVMLRGLFSVTGFLPLDESVSSEQIQDIMDKKNALIPNCLNCASPCGRTLNYDMSLFRNSEESVRSLKTVLLTGLCQMSVYAYHAIMLGYSDPDIDAFFYEGLFAIGENWHQEFLIPVISKLGNMQIKCMDLFEKANRDVYGHSVAAVLPFPLSDRNHVLK